MAKISKSTAEAGSIRGRILDLQAAQYESEVYAQSKCFRDFSDFRLTSYGLVDPIGVFSEPIYEYTYMPLHEGSSLMAMNFVSDQFASMKRKFEEISSKAGNYGYLSPIRAGMRGDDLYLEHLEVLIDAFTDVAFKLESSKMVDFRSYCKLFVEFIKKSRHSSVVGGAPVSKSCFFNSSHCPQHVSGLVVDLRDDGYNDPSQISQEWRQDPNFELYLDAAHRSGFFVDIKFPFRLVANISSIPMARAAEYYGAAYTPGYGKSIFENFYVPVSSTDLYRIKDALFRGYQSVAEPNPTIFNKSSCGHKIRVSKMKRQILNLSNVIAPQISGKKLSSSDLLGQAATVHEKLAYGLHDERYDLLFFFD